LGGFATRAFDRQTNREMAETDGRKVDFDPVDLIFARARVDLE
jgi:hypothetical protein